MNKWLTTICIIVVLIIASVPVTASNGVEPCGDTEEKVIEDRDVDFNIHTEYSFKFSERNKNLCVRVENKGSEKYRGGFTIQADGTGVKEPSISLDSGESSKMVIDLTERFDVLRVNHTVQTGTQGKQIEFNFTQDFNASSPDVASPYITDVDVLRNHENDTTALEVSTHNPSKLGYNFYVQAETFETKGVYRVDAPQENETSQVVLPLNESSDDVVAGKIRIFDNWGNSDGKFDQKEFMAKPGNETNAWDDHFERVPGTIDRYEYDNETARQYREDYVDRDLLSPLERRVGAGLLVAVLIGAVWWRRR